MALLPVVILLPMVMAAICVLAGRVGNALRDALVSLTGAVIFALCVLIAVNASCLELFPGSLIALRQSCGSVRPAAIVLPTLLSSLAATVVAVLLCLFCIRTCRSRSSCCR